MTISVPPEFAALLRGCAMKQCKSISAILEDAVMSMMSTAQMADIPLLFASLPGNKRVPHRCTKKASIEEEESGQCLPEW